MTVPELGKPHDLAPLLDPLDDGRPDRTSARRDADPDARRGVQPPREPLVDAATRPDELDRQIWLQVALVSDEIARVGLEVRLLRSLFSVHLP